MVKRTWNNREITDALHRLGASYELPPERSAALEARVRREVISRYGGLAMPLAIADSPDAPAGAGRQPIADSRFGMLGLSHALRNLGGAGRPALALAALGVLVVGAVAVTRSLGGATPTSGEVLELPLPAVVVRTAPVEPGSGVAVSVFGVSTSTTSATTSPSAPTPTVRRAYRPRARPINPAEGVFTQWGQSVFSEEELLKVQREGKTI